MSFDHDTLEDPMNSTIRFDGAGEFGSSSSFQGGGTDIAYCNDCVIVTMPVDGFSCDQNTRADGAIRICK
jgi:hypothetical protein